MSLTEGLSEGAGDDGGLPLSSSVSMPPLPAAKNASSAELSGDSRGSKSCSWLLTAVGGGDFV